MVATSTTCQSSWLESLFADLKIKLDSVVQLNMDNKSAICLANNPISHGRTKHIVEKFYKFREKTWRSELLKLELGRNVDVSI